METVKPSLARMRRIATEKGDVLHGMKASDPGFAGFGEAYFSTIAAGETKGWKRHRQMTMNLLCVHGVIRFVVHKGDGEGDWLDVTLSPKDDASYQRLTVPPMYWVAFHGVFGSDSLLINLASLEHDPHEADNVPLSAFPWPL